MRSLIAIVSVVALMWYGAYVSEYGEAAGVSPKAVALPDPGILTRAAGLAGAAPFQLMIVGWMEVPHRGTLTQVEQALRWSETEAVRGERRALEVHQADERLVLSLRWHLPAEAAPRWSAAVETASEALALVTGGKPAQWTVQLEATAPPDHAERLVTEVALAMKGHSLQWWRESQAASVAGLTTLLPNSPLGVNFQVAARQRSGDRHTTIWVAWPSLLQEY